MGHLEIALVGVGAVEAALLLLLNWRAYQDEMEYFDGGE